MDSASQGLACVLPTRILLLAVILVGCQTTQAPAMTKEEAVAVVENYVQRKGMKPGKDYVIDLASRHKRNWTVWVFYLPAVPEGHAIFIVSPKGISEVSERGMPFRPLPPN